MVIQKLNKSAKAKHYLVSILLIIIVAQVFTIYMINENSRESIEAEKALNSKISLNNQDLQSKINTITTSLTSIISAQSSLQKELSVVKATKSADFSGIIESEKRGVVTIKTDISQGTGFIITDDGYVVTNHHVMDGASAAAIITYDRKSHNVRLIGSNPLNDVALLKIEGTFNPTSLGDSDVSKIGEKVIAIGNPLGLEFTVTEGIISARDRLGANNQPFYFQIDVPLNPGNSGGPLINKDGEVIGINNFKVQEAEGLGFALEINQAIKVINAIAEQKLNQTII